MESVVLVQTGEFENVIMNKTIKHYTELLNSNTPFAFSRYGDGEWLAILGANKGANVDGQRYTPELTAALRDSLNMRDEMFFHALNPVAWRVGRERIQNYMWDNGLVIDWHPGDVFLQASIDGELNPFVKALRQRNVCYVGPSYLKGFAREQLNVNAYITVPESNSFDVWPQICASVLDRVEDVVLFSAGMATNVFVDRVWRISKGSKTLIDLGSLWEGYVANGAKRSHKAKLTQESVRCNLAK